MGHVYIKYHILRNIYPYYTFLFTLNITFGYFDETAVNRFRTTIALSVMG